jgi:hypothetical protein
MRFKFHGNEQQVRTTENGSQKADIIKNTPQLEVIKKRLIINTPLAVR